MTEKKLPTRPGSIVWINDEPNRVYMLCQSGHWAAIDTSFGLLNTFTVQENRIALFDWEEITPC